MKNIVMIIVMMFAAAFAMAADTAVKSGTVNGRMQIYYHWSPEDANDDFNDVDVKVYDDFYGDIESIIIDPNGTITNYSISILIDPREIGETQIYKLYTLNSYTLADSNDHFYPVIIPGSNPAFAKTSPTVIGDLYIERGDIDPNINDLKIWLNCKDR